MNKVAFKLIVPFSVLILYSCKAPHSNTNTHVSIKTTLGEIRIRLYDDTPVHRDNFIKLVNAGLYENTLFHRVIKDFMIQAGDPSTRPSASKIFPDSVNTYTIPAEFKPYLFHKKGALAAARRGNEENPQMRSSGTQFYIVQGTKYTDSELDQAQQKITSNLKQAFFNKLIRSVSDSLRSAGKTSADSEIQEIASVRMFEWLSTNQNYIIPEDQRTVYKTLGGVPRLDGTYTVFGEVTEGMDVVDRIAAVSTDSNDKPQSDIRILKIKIISK